MAEVFDQSRPSGVQHHAQGSISGTYTAAASYTITLGFVPRYFKVTNMTDRVTQEWYKGMNTGDFLETAAAGTRTLETDDKLVVNTDGTVTIVSNGGAVTDNDTVVWEAWA